MQVIEVGHPSGFNFTFALAEADQSFRSVFL